MGNDLSGLAAQFAQCTPPSSWAALVEFCGTQRATIDHAWDSCRTRRLIVVLAVLLADGGVVEQMCEDSFSYATIR